MKNKLIKILNDIDEAIAEYDGENLFDDGVVDSFTVVEIVTEIEAAFRIEISADDVTEHNFCTVDNMLELIEAVLKKKVDE